MGRFIEAAPDSRASQMTPMKLASVIVAIVIATGGLDTLQVAFAFIGACVYALVCTLPFKPSGAKKVGHKTRGGPDGRAAAAALKRVADEVRQRSISIRPVSAPTFTAVGFDAEVEELLGSILPTPESDKFLEKLVARVKATVLPIIPKAEVTAFACSDPRRGGAFAVAVPEVDVVISVKPAVLAACLRSKAKVKPSADGDYSTLNKAGVRRITSQLVAFGGFKFRRSSFRMLEPKVTLLSPSACDDLQDAIGVDVSVNAISPLWHAALLTECGYIDARARGLILLVRRWAKARALCHVAKGNLSPIAWSLLAIFFLQVGVMGEGALLPPLDDFKMSSRIARAGSEAAAPHQAPWSRPIADGPKKSVAELFRDFFVFYHKIFDWRGEAVSIRAATRAGPGLRLPLNVLMHPNGQTVVGPSIEDPFDSAHNLGDTMISSSYVRLGPEIARAAAMCSSRESLTSLLVPWVPPETMESEDEPALPLHNQMVFEVANEAQIGGPRAQLGSLQEEHSDSSCQHQSALSPRPMADPTQKLVMCHQQPDENWNGYQDWAHNYQ